MSFLSHVKLIEELEKLRESFYNIVERSSEGIIVLDEKKNIAFMNNAAEDILGRDFENLKNQYFGEVIIGDKGCIELEVLHPDGSTRVVECRITPSEWQGKSAQLVLLRDITERKEAEKILRESERRLRALIENAMDIIALFDEDGNILYISPSAGRILGYEIEELTGSSIFGFLHPEEWKSVKETFKEITSAAKISRPIRFRVRHKDGLWRHLEGIFNNLLKEPNINAILMNARDITEYEKLQQQLIQAQKMEAIGSLTGGIAHDFNNMLQVILGYTELTIKKLDPSNPLINNLLQIKKTTKKAAELVKKLLAFSRKQILEKKVLNLNELITEHIKMLERVIPENIELFISTNAEDPIVFADPSGIEQVVMNLVVNARDAMPKGGKLFIETANECLEEPKGEDLKPGEYVTISVEDTGVGMDEKTLSRIFEPFFTTKEKGRGTGLGLSVVWGIVKQHDGHIEVWSAPGKGTKFKIYLPVYKVEEGKTEEAKGEVDIDKFRGNETILIAEDQEEIIALLKETLENLGYKVILAKDGLEAIELFEKNKNAVNLLILDVVMPKIDGYEVYESILSHNPKIPVIFMSGYSEENVEEKIKDKSFVSMIAKPFTPGLILQKIREMLDKTL